MRALILAPLAFVATALVAASPPPSVPVTVAELAVPQDHGEQVVLVQARTFAAGANAGWHVHPGTEIAYVVSGEMELRTADGVRRLKAGESFVMPRGAAHDGGNPGRKPARLVITLVVDKGVPPRESVPAPVR